MLKKTFVFSLLMLSFSYAKEPFSSVIVVADQSATVTAPNLIDLKRELKTSQIEKLIPSYTETSQVAFGINLRGVKALAGFQAGSTTLTLFIPNIGVSKTFTGSTRDESFALFKQYIADSGNKNGLLKAFAKYSPIDPMAGNPNSLMTSMGLSDYSLGRLFPLSGCCYSAQPITSMLQVGLDGGRAFTSDYDTTTATIPLRYSYSRDGESAFIIDAPLTYLRNGGASSLIASVGIGYRYQVTSAWSLTPVLRAGSGGSLDLIASCNFVSAGITSNYNLKLYDFVFSMTNYAGYITSANFWLTGINFNYHLQNYVFNNGLDVVDCEGFSICDRKFHLGLSFLDSYFTKNDLYMRHFDEVGVSLTTKDINPFTCSDFCTIKFTYQFGNHDYRGYIVKLDYLF